MGAVVSTGAYLSIHNAGVGGSSPPVATIITFTFNTLCLP